MSRGTLDVFEQLHSLLATGMAAELRRAIERAALDLEDPNYAPLNPQLLDKAMKFVKDNGIDAPASNKPLNDLASELANLDLDDPAITGQLRH
jgi:hypothetical protein